MAKIVDPEELSVNYRPPNGVQRSTTGYSLDPNVPGEYYDAADNMRRRVGSEASNLAMINPALGWKGSDYEGGKNTIPFDASYSLINFPYGDEGSISMFAQKYGLDLTKRIVNALPTMNRQQLMVVNSMMQSAIDEYSSQRARERMAYERAGMQYKQGQYRLK